MNCYYKNKKFRWFTLVEILIVVVIIGILWSVFAVKLQSWVVKARDVKRKADIRVIFSALQTNKSDKWTFPPAQNEWWTPCAINNIICGVYSRQTTNKNRIDNIRWYIWVVPQDPINENWKVPRAPHKWFWVNSLWTNRGFAYYYGNVFSENWPAGWDDFFWLVARLENSDDRDGCWSRNANPDPLDDYKDIYGVSIPCTGSDPIMNSDLYQIWYK